MELLISNRFSFYLFIFSLLISSCAGNGKKQNVYRTNNNFLIINWGQSIKIEEGANIDSLLSFYDKKIEEITKLHQSKSDQLKAFLKENPEVLSAPLLPAIYYDDSLTTLRRRKMNLRETYIDIILKDLGRSISGKKGSVLKYYYKEKQKEKYYYTGQWRDMIYIKQANLPEPDSFSLIIPKIDFLIEVDISIDADPKALCVYEYQDEHRIINELLDKSPSNVEFFIQSEILEKIDISKYDTRAKVNDGLITMKYVCNSIYIPNIVNITSKYENGRFISERASKAYFTKQDIFFDLVLRNRTIKHNWVGLHIFSNSKTSKKSKMRKIPILNMKLTKLD